MSIDTCAMEDVLYRFESYNVSKGCDEYDNPYPGHNVVLSLQEIKIIKRTPKGAWIISFANKSGKKFVLLTARKQYASNTIEEAANQFKFRKHRYIAILQARIDDSIKALNQLDYEVERELRIK